MLRRKVLSRGEKQSATDPLEVLTEVNLAEFLNG